MIDLEKAEMSVMGALLMKNESYDVVSKILDEDDFSTRKARITYRAIKECIGSSVKEIDLMVLTDKMREEGTLDQVGIDYVAGLTTVLPTAANVEYYAQKVRDASIRRGLAHTARLILDRVEDKTRTTPELINEIETQLTGVRRSKAGEYVSVKSIVGEAMDEIERWYNSKGRCTGIECGIAAVDSMTSGFQNGEMYVIGARASIGKTAFALTAAANIAERRVVGFLSLEMSNKMLITRLLSMESRVDSHKVRTGLLNHDDLSKIMTGGSRVYEKRLFLYDFPNAHILDVKSKIRTMVHRDNVEIVFVDYIGLIRPEDRRLPRHEQVSVVSKELKEIARELDIPVVVLAQLNRQAEGKAPSLSELKESGALEEDADVVILLHRERDNNEEQKKSIVVPVDIFVAKNRNGATGSDKIAFHKRYTRFENLSHTQEEKTA